MESGHTVYTRPDMTELHLKRESRGCGHTLCLPCKIGKHRLEFYLDSGSTFSTIPLQTVIVCGLLDKIKSVTDGTQCLPASIGRLRVTLTCEKKIVIHSVMEVMENMPHLLGLDVFYNYHCSIKMSPTHPTLLVRGCYHIMMVKAEDDLIMWCHVGKYKVPALVDTDSALTFIHPNLQQHLKLRAQEATTTLTVTNALGEEILLKHKIKNVPIYLQGKTSYLDVYVYDGFDPMIIGMDFLTGMELKFIHPNKVIIKKINM
ncbi:uncharacterized protein [Procambarus clarkii]|uniref:uncharacterized protein isoform X2 n=1 Tax=Procambarus clarkii TaxID=6728 RepID=UPI00374364E6